MILEILGPPVTKKNSQRIMRRKDGRPFIMQSKQGCSWAKDAMRQLRAQWTAPPIDHHVNLSCVVYRKKNVGDLLNYLAAVSDALEAAGVVDNDRLIVSLDNCRMDKDKDNPRVWISLSVVAW